MRVVSIKEATEIMSIGRTTVYRLIGEKRLLTVRIGSRRLVRLDSIAALLEQEAA
jgi:excisionase family DNA binding protein